MTILVLEFEKRESDEKKNDTFCLNSKAETIINESYIDDVFQPIYSAVISDMQKLLRKAPGRNFSSVIDYNLLFQSTNLWLIAVVSNYPKN